MSKKNFIEACVAASNCTMAHSRNELNLFCEIMGLPKSEVNYFIGDDPHGVVDIMDGYYCFNMTDIHVVISEYEHWMEIYKTNEELRKAVDAWYYYCIDWHQKHPAMTWTKPEHEPYDGQKTIVAYERSNGEIDYQSDVFFDELGWEGFEREDVRYWLELTKPDDTYCPNLRSWLAGCPVEGLRDATLEWQTQREKDLQAAHQRVEECKQALEDAIKKEVKLNKF